MAFNCRKITGFKGGIKSPGIYSRPQMPTSRSVDWSFNRNRAAYKLDTRARIGVQQPDGTIVWLAQGTGREMGKAFAAIHGV